WSYRKACTRRHTTSGGSECLTTALTSKKTSLFSAQTITPCATIAASSCTCAHSGLTPRTVLGRSTSTITTLMSSANRNQTCSRRKRRFLNCRPTGDFQNLLEAAFWKYDSLHKEPRDTGGGNLRNRRCVMPCVNCFKDSSPLLERDPQGDGSTLVNL